MNNDFYNRWLADALEDQFTTNVDFGKDSCSHKILDNHISVIARIPGSHSEYLMDKELADLVIAN